MHSLLGVGLGSERESQLLVMQWKGASDRKTAPVAFVGNNLYDTTRPAFGRRATLSGGEGQMLAAAAKIVKEQGQSSIYIASGLLALSLVPRVSWHTGCRRAVQPEQRVEHDQQAREPE